MSDDFPRILLLGSQGQVGRELQRALQHVGHVVTAARDGAELAVDLQQPASVRELLTRVSPALIVNAAAYTAVDKAESEPDIAETVNGDAPAILAEAAKASGAMLVHYSTDYVFDGAAGTPYEETDAPSPVSVYGQTKLLGEEAIMGSGCRALILRTSWVYSASRQNFFRTMLKLFRSREEVSVVADQYGCPTWASTVADVSSHLVRDCLSGRYPLNDAEIFHLVSDGQCSWYEFAAEIHRLASARGDLRTKRVLPIATSEFPTAARRPVYSVLSTKKLQQAFGLRLPFWKDSLRNCFRAADDAADTLDQE